MIYVEYYMPSFVNAKAVSFDGIDEYFDLDAYCPNLWFNAPASISFWYKPSLSHLTNNSVIYSAARNPETATTRFFIGYGPVSGTVPNGVLTVVKNGSVIGFTDASSAPYLNLWNHFVVIQTGTTSTFYHNGTLKTTTVGASTGDNGDYGDGVVLADKDNLRWMNRVLSGGFGEGILDEMSIWDKVLSGAEVSAIYNAGSPNDLLDASVHPTGNLIAWWRNGDGTGDAIDGSLGNDPANRIYDQTANGYNVTPGATMTSANIVTDAP